MASRYRVSRRSLSFLAVLILGTLQLQAVMTGTAAAQNNACNGAFSGNPSGTLAVASSPSNGSTVSPGSAISFTITWDTGDWTGLDQYQSCFEVNGSLVSSLSFGEFPPANDGTIHHSITVPGNLSAGDQLCMRGRLSGQPTGGVSTQKSNTVCFTIGSGPQGNPDVRVAKSSSATNLRPGDQFSYTLTAENVGNAGATGVEIRDTIPAGLTILNVPNSCSVNGQTVVCSIGNLAQGASQSVTFAVRATDGACPKVDNFGTVSATNEPQGNTGNNTSNTVTVSVACDKPDVEIRKASGAPSGGVAPGASFTYTITVRNVGGAEATNVTVRDTVPAGLSIVSSSNNCSTSGQTLTCDLGSVAAGANESVSITVQATEDACPQVTNVAIVTAGNEPSGNTGNNTSNQVTDLVNCLEPGIHVRIVKSNDANADGIFTNSEEAKTNGLDVPFELVITNTGSETIEIDTLTDEFEQTTLDLLAAKCATLDGVILDPGESVTCTFTLNDYSPPQGTSLDNTAEVCVHMEGDTSVTACDDDDSRVRSAVVLGTTVTPPPTRTPPGGIAFTGPGSGAVGFGLLALALLLLGTGLLWAGNRKREGYER
jgi:uncharacterized repeat protein (TIGR01451 family)